ncbi:lipocalin family protein [Salegentibacter sp. LM13S]|uniref:lipocalin family protein n=1 Tax=Salegentibacter lacus TaxID=2873599 RepID=UPI001CCAC7A7|nr:lipocalin family protein [Salegentibacter lacus]MBZ9629903.1 lipocalin family protein [Salegentibacter lacus]
MKKVSFIPILFLIFSCSSDDDSEVQSEATILGSWIGVESYLDGESMGQPSNDRVEFFSDNSVEFTYDDITEYGEFVIDGDILTITWESAETGLETYSLEINELTETTLEWETDLGSEGILIEIFRR